MPTVDVFIPSTGRASLPLVLDQWRHLAVNLRPYIQLSVYGIADGPRALDIARTADWIIKTPNITERPGDLVGQAIAWSKADYVVHGFDDDPPSAIDALIHAAETVDAGWASGRVAEYRHGRPTGIIYSGVPTDALLHRNSVPLQGCVFRRNVFKKIPFTCIESLPWSYDWELALRLHYGKVKHAHVDQVVGIWNLNPDGMTAQTDTPLHASLWQERRRDIHARYHADTHRR